MSSSAPPVTALPRSVAVVVCAYTMDRWADVVEAYESLVKQERPADEVVLVIDHNDDLLTALQITFPNATIIANTGPRGLSGARNTGVAATSSDLVLFLDDDAKADPQWVSRMLSVFTSADVIGVAGHAVPVWARPGKPAWFPEEFLWVVGCSYTGLPTSRTAVRNPIGCNMGFTRAALDSTTGFSTSIGRVGTHPVGCEETELSIRMRQAQPAARIILEPGAVVHHRVSEARLTFRYFTSRCYWEGVSKAIVSGDVGSGDALSAERSYTTTVLPKAVLRGVGDALRGDLSGLGRAGAVVVGFALTGLGFVRGTLSRRKAAAPHVRNVPVTSSTETDLPAAAPQVWCTEVDLGGEVAGRIPVPAHEAPFGSARILVRLHGETLTFVERPVVDGFFVLGDVVSGLSDAARARLDGHLAEDGGSVQVVDGVPYVHAPFDCARTRPSGLSMTVVVCTRGRGEALRSCLATLARMDYPDLDFVIVDNAPTDDTTHAAFLAEVGEDTRFRYVVEPRPGLSCARNRGLAEARGDLIAYTDDDVTVDPRWADALVTGFLRRPDVACVTSLVCTASLETPAEHYFDARVSWAARSEPRIYDAVAPEGDALYPYSAGLFGTGAGMAFRTSVVRELGGFDEALGAGTRTAGGEDLDAFVMVLHSGAAIAYEPSSVVWHHHRADLAGLRKQMYAYGTGLTAFMMKHLLDGGTRGTLLRRIPRGIVKMASIPKATTASVGTSESAVPARALLVREFAGMAMGPVLYWIGRRNIPSQDAKDARASS